MAVNQPPEWQCQQLRGLHTRLSSSDGQTGCRWMYPTNVGRAKEKYDELDVMQQRANGVTWCSQWLEDQ